MAEPALAAPSGPTDSPPVTGAAVPPAPARSGPERFLLNFFHHLTDGPAFLGMVAGGLSYRVTRLSTLKFLFRNPLRPEMFQVMGRRTMAQILAVGAETSAFTAAVKGSQKYIWKQPTPAAETWIRDWYSAGLMFSSLRLFGWGATALGGGLNRLVPIGSLSRTGLNQLGMYTGILAAQAVERKFPWPLSIPGGNRASQEDPYEAALASLVFFNGAGFLLKGLTPKKIKDMEQEVDHEIHNLLGEISPPSIPPGFALAMAHHTPSTFGEGSFPGSRITTSRRWISREWDPATQRSLETLDRAYGKGQELLATLQQSQITDPRTLQIGLGRLAFMVRHSDPIRPKGTYVDWITRLALQDIIEKQQVQTLDGLLTRLNQGTTLLEYEAFLAPHLSPSRLAGADPIRSLTAPFKTPGYELIRSLDLSPKAKKVLQRYLSDPKRKDMPHSRFTYGPHGIADLAFALKNKENHDFIESALLSAAKSPLALHRIERLLLTMIDGGPLLASRVHELADAEFILWGSDLRTSPHVLQLQGYFVDPAYLPLVKEIYQHLRLFTDPFEQDMRAANRNDLLQLVWRHKAKSEDFTPEEVITAFELLGDPFAREIAETLRGGKIDLEFLPSSVESSPSRAVDSHGSNAADLWADHGAYRPAKGNQKAVITVESPRLEHTDPEGSSRRVFKMLADVVTQYEVHRRAGNDPSPLPLLRKAWWTGQYGDGWLLERMKKEGYAGPGLYLRNIMERTEPTKTRGYLDFKPDRR
jgi:hypothetical protein